MSWVPEEVPPELKDAIHKKIHRNCKSWTYTVCLGYQRRSHLNSKMLFIRKYIEIASHGHIQYVYGYQRRSHLNSKMLFIRKCIEIAGHGHVCAWVPEEVQPELKDAIHQKMHRNGWLWT
jgi:hypothetical protein